MGQPTRLTQPPTLSGTGMSSISVAMGKLLSAVSPSSECLYEGKADVMYLQVTVWSTSERLVVDLLTIGVMQVPLPMLSRRYVNNILLSKAYNLLQLKDQTISSSDWPMYRRMSRRLRSGTTPSVVNTLAQYHWELLSTCGVPATYLRTDTS